MSGLLREALGVLRPHVPLALIPPPAFEAIHGVADALAPVVRLGLECPLGGLGGGGSVDVSQLLRSTEDGATRLRSLAARSAGHPAWENIAGLAAAWTTGRRFGGRDVDLVWLEYDLDRSGRRAPVPSVFVGLAGPDGASVETIRDVLAALGADGPEGGRSVARVLTAAGRRGGCALPLTGAMVARGGEPRVGIRGLAPGAVAAFLDDVGWQGVPGEAQAWAERLAPLCGQMILWLELAPSPRPRLGLEFVYADDTDPTLLPRMLDDLAAAGCCTRDERDALLGWSGVDHPGTTQALWPEALLVASLHRPPNEFSVLRRFVHHVKVSVGGGPPRGKAYLGFVHSWDKRVPKTDRNAA